MDLLAQFNEKLISYAKKYEKWAELYRNDNRNHNIKKLETKTKLH